MPVFLFILVAFLSLIEGKILLTPSGIANLEYDFIIVGGMPPNPSTTLDPDWI